MAQGWAGSQPIASMFKCAICLQRDKAIRDAVTQIMGTLVCQLHVDYLPMNVYVPRDE